LEWSNVIGTDSRETGWAGRGWSPSGLGAGCWSPSVALVSHGV